MGRLHESKVLFFTSQPIKMEECPQFRGQMKIPFPSTRRLDLGQPWKDPLQYLQGDPAWSLEALVPQLLGQTAWDCPSTPPHLGHTHSDKSWSWSQPHPLQEGPRACLGFPSCRVPVSLSGARHLEWLVVHNPRLSQTQKCSAPAALC